MSAGCTEPTFQNWLHAYELGLLSESDSERLEEHLMDCPSCFARINHLREVTELINSDSDVHKLIRTIDNESPDSRPTRAIERSKKERTPLTRYMPISIAAAALLIFLILQPWQIEIRPDQEAMAAPNRLAVMHFANLTDATDSSSTGAMLVNLLTADLSGSEYLQVIPQRQISTLYRYLGFEDPEVPPDSQLPEIARQTSARYILTGDIRSEDSLTVVRVEVHDLTANQKIASVEVSGSQGDSIFALVDRLTVLVKATLDLPEEALGELDPCVADITTESSEAYYHYVKAKYAISRMYPAEAARRYELALGLDHTFAVAWYGLWQLRGGDYIDSALAYSHKATDIERHFIRAGKATSLGDIESAKLEIRRVLELWPEEPQALLGLANFEIQAERYDSAIHYLHRSIKSDPLFKMAHNQLAYAYQLAGDLEKAIETVDKYIAIAPGEPNPYDTKGDLYAANGLIAEAMKCYSEALRVVPEFNFSAWKLGHLLLFSGDLDSAYSVYKATTQSNIASVRAFSRQFMAYPLIIRGQYNDALMLLDDGIGADRLEDQSLPAAFKYLMKATIHAEQSNPLGALAEAQAGRQLLNRDDSAFVRTFELQYALLMTRLDSLTAARSVAQRFLQDIGVGTRDSSIYLLIEGAISLSQGNQTQAKVKLERAAELSDRFEIGFLLATTLLETGEPGRSAELMESLLSDYSGSRAMHGLWSVRMHYYLGLAYQATGRNGQAIEQYERFLRIRTGADFESQAMADARARLISLKSKS